MEALVGPVTARGILLAGGGVLAFVGALLAGCALLPGRAIEGLPLADGSRLRYVRNGLTLHLITMALVIGVGLYDPSLPAALLTHFWSLLIATNLFALVFTVALYLKGRRAGAPHRSGPAGLVADLFLGLELNPMWRGVELKFFSYRPSLIGMAVIDLAFAFAQIQRHGHLAPRLMLFELFQLVYLTSHFQFEELLVSTWDIIAEKFGWMLVFGDYVFVPFLYAVGGFFLVDDLTPIPAWQVGALVGLYAVGFVLFRGTNSQKHSYRMDPGARIWGKAPEALGGRLLVSGFWGVGRKLNYTGELLLYYAWTIPCGLSSVVPWLVPLWLTGFFPHRAWRDERRCKAKYGPLWDEYCQRARFRMIPFLF